MLVYPQLTSAALSQFPAMRRRRVRTVVNAAADGSSVKLEDGGGGTTEWQLSYSALRDAELDTLQQFFVSAEGSLNGFIFVDPNANLLAWSEVLTNSAWQADPSLVLKGGVADAVGGSGGWTITNQGAGPQSVTQTLNAPGGYGYCFSVFVRADQPSPVTLSAGSSSDTCEAGTNWTRIATCGSGDASGTSVAFGIAVPAGGVLEVFGPQVEVQEAPSIYQTSTNGGIYANTRFRDDVLAFTTTGVGRHSATVNLFYANHL